MALARIPRGPTSLASAFVSARPASRGRRRRSRIGVRVRAKIASTFTIAPCVVSKAGKTCRATWSAETTFQFVVTAPLVVAGGRKSQSRHFAQRCDRAIESTEARQRGADEFIELVRIRDVGLGAERVQTEQLLGARESLLITSTDRDERAFGDQALGERETEPVGTASDEKCSV